MADPTEVLKQAQPAPYGYLDRYNVFYPAPVPGLKLVPIYAAPPAQPVAWRMVTPSAGRVIYIEDAQEAARFAAMDRREVKPLYAAPPAQPDYQRFALAVLIQSRDHLGYDVDGGLVQDMATECGLLDKIIAEQPCGDDCVCAEYGAFPHACYCYSPAVLQALAEQPHHPNQENP